jgi:hypothetical protein
LAYAYVKVHQPEALCPLQDGGEPSAVFCWVFLLVFTGPSAFALDRLFAPRNDAERGGPRPRAGVGGHGLIRGPVPDARPSATVRAGYHFPTVQMWRVRYTTSSAH